MTKRWDYGGAYLRHDMSGEIHLPGGIVQVHDIFNPLPPFMRLADCLFCDPPCSKGNLNSFYTKADLVGLHDSYEPFGGRLMDVIEEIDPKQVFIEVFAANKDLLEALLGRHFKHLHIYRTSYYHRPKNRCWIINASNEPLSIHPFEGMDEEDVIFAIPERVPFACIADPCMGRGLVGKAALRAGRRFVGTELNPKRLACLVDFCLNESLPKP